MTIQQIPLNQLIPSKANVRKTGAGSGIDELAASIKAHGLLQNLQVRPAEGGKFEVVAGMRRLAALKRLVKSKDIEKSAEVACHVLDGDDASEISLAENVMRLPMHADRLAAALSLDMAQWWQPSARSYLGRVAKARVLEAVAEGVSPSAAENLAKLKKDALVKLAEERLAGTGWLGL